MTRRCSWRVIWLFILLCSPWFAIGETQEELQAMIQRAMEMNNTAPRVETQDLLQKIVPLLDKATPQQKAQVNLLRARHFALAGQYERGLALLEGVLAGQPSLKQRVRALEMSANLAVNIGDFEIAFQSISKALELAPELDDPELTSAIFSLAGYLFGQVGEMENAREYGRRAIAIAHNAGLVRTECVVLQRFGYAFQKSGDLVKAEAAYRRAIDLCRQAHDPVFIAIVEVSLAEVLRRQGRVEEAEDLLVRGLERMQIAGFTDGVLDGKQVLANLRFDQGRYEQAKAILAPLLEPLRERGLWEKVAEVESLLAKVAQNQGNLTEALHHFRAHKAASEKFLDRERAMRLAYLGVAFDIQRREQEMALLREQNRVLQLEEEARASQRIIYIGGAAGLILIGVLLFLLLIRSHADRRRFRRLSESDGLTGLYNHTQFFSLGEQALSASQQEGEPFTLVIADIDHFKQINDHYGHVFGDEMLRMVSARLREVFEKAGIVGRIGGEEFGIALPGLTAQQAARRVERFRERLKSLREEDEAFRVTVSFGLAQADNGTSLESLRLRADHALYYAKRAGRDRVVNARDVPDGAFAPGV